MRKPLACLTVTLIAFALMSAPANAALLTPSDLHPQALWGGSAGGDDKLIWPDEVTALVDGDPATTWTSGSNYQPAMGIMSPRPFVVQTVTVVASSDSRPERSAGTIEVMTVGSAEYVNSGLSVPNTLSAGETWTGTIPAQYQVPLSGIRHNGGHHVHMNELEFHGYAVGSGLIDITEQGMLVTDPGSEDPPGTLTNGVLETTAEGYIHPANGEDHKIVFDFGDDPQDVAYIAVNPNQYWKLNEVRSIGANGSYDIDSMDTYSDWATGSYSQMSGQDNPGHSWVVLPFNDGTGTALTAAGFISTDHHGEFSEVVLLAVPEPVAVPEPASLTLSLLGLLGLLGLLAVGALRRLRRDG